MLIPTYQQWLHAMLPHSHNEECIFLFLKLVSLKAANLAALEMYYAKLASMYSTTQLYFSLCLRV